jgi:hypothetical protein
MRRTLLLIAATFAAGVGVGYLLRPEPSTDRAARQAAATAPVGDAETILVERTLLSQPPDPVPAGDGRILGHVRNDTGTPLEGVLVVATFVRDFGPRKTPKGAPGPADRDIEELAREFAAREQWERAARRTARTAADGSYEITGLAQRKWRIEAYKEGHQFERTPSSRGYAEPGDTIDFTGAQVVQIDVDVRLPNGEQPESAQIYAEQRTGNTSATTSEPWLPSAPWIELKPETYDLSAADGGTAKSAPQTVKVVPGGTPRLRFELRDQPVLRVRVVRPDGIEPTFLDVMLLKFTGSEPPDAARLPAEASRITLHPPDEWARWADLAPGSYLIGARMREGPVAVTRVVTVGAGTSEHELRMPPMGAKELIGVRARGPNGTPLRVEGCMLAYRTPERVVHRGSEVARRVDGACLLWRPVAQAGDAEGRYVVTAHARGLGRASQDWDSRSDEVVVAFAEPSYVNVVLAGYAESPHSGWLGIGLTNGPESGYEMARADGRTRRGPVQPGPWEVVVYAVQGVTGGSVPAATIPIDLQSGERSLTIEIPVLHVLTVRWGGGAAGRSVFVQPKAPRSHGFYRTITEDATRIERLPEGRYEIRASGGRTKMRPVEIDIPYQTEITVE